MFLRQERMESAVEIGVARRAGAATASRTPPPLNDARKSPPG